MLEESIQKLVELTTLVSANTYRFPVEDATGFAYVLPPARKLSLSRRSLTGILPGNKCGAETPAAFESSLERDFFVLQEFEEGVCRYYPQPVRISVPASEDRRATVYTPDVLVERHT